MAGYGVSSWEFNPDPYVEAAAEGLYDAYSELNGDPAEDRWVNLPDTGPVRTIWRHLAEQALAPVLPRMIGDVVTKVGQAVGVEVLDVITRDGDG